MSPRLKWMLLSGALGVSAWLALFGDKTPPGEAAMEAPAAESPTPSAEAAPAVHHPPPTPAQWRAWRDLPRNPFGGPTTPVADASAPTPTALDEPPFTLIGRSTQQGRTQLHALDRAGELRTLQVGQRADGWRVLALTAEALVLRRERDRHEIRLPLDRPDGVFEQARPSEKPTE